ncbi:hypothetical protein LB467_08625 [Salegentibacter sp. JZCK2]|uniref:hypothetical protein n=1 Tax=Salegentibacter tibetensis TaxID=2873600 RepID=UPI001CCA8224|nr:hypothetical protein [Salegentibacter tibetensis]MBZ9729753.1 hypothetical protein [Salegentibacter tibetensis]
MIQVELPSLREEKNCVFITSEIIVSGSPFSLWYKFPLKLKNFLVTENLDAFLVAILTLGLKKGEDIYLKGALSARLNYSLNHYLIPALCLANPNFSKIRIFTEDLNEEDLNVGNIAGTGLSCGIDSFATYFDHINEKGAYKIEYFTFFNVGSHGDFGGENSRKLFHRRLKSVKEFSEKVGKEIIDVDSNLSEILKMNFQEAHSFRNISCALHLQKLFKNYYYASAYRLDHFRLNFADTSDSDLLYLSFLSTESTNFYSSVSQYSRVERTKLISQYTETYNYLNVCTEPNENKTFINCSRCYKCLRTQLTLDLLGKLDFYSNVFNLREYQKAKNSYIGDILEKNSKSPLDIELIEYLKNTKSFNAFSVVLYTCKAFINLRKKALRKFLKVKFGRK